MFSGIISALAKPVAVTEMTDGMRLRFPLPKRWKMASGDSVAIDGICSTVEEKDTQTFSVFFMHETLKKTSLNVLSIEHTYNLEQPLTLQTLISGHLVAGHVDATGEVSEIQEDGEAKIFTFKIPKEFSQYVVYKGSIAINGVSLTIVSSTKTMLTVSLIPFTLTNTNLGELQKGDKVNLEFDMIAKYLEKLAKK